MLKTRNFYDTKVWNKYSLYQNIKKVRKCGGKERTMGKRVPWKMICRVWNLTLAVLAIVYLVCLLVPADARGIFASSMAYASDGELFIVSPGG